MTPDSSQSSPTKPDLWHLFHLSCAASDMGIEVQHREHDGLHSFEWRDTLTRTLISGPKATTREEAFDLACDSLVEYFTKQ